MKLCRSCYYRRRSKKYKADGLCSQCGTNLVGGFKTCEKCRVSQRKATKRIRQLRSRNASLCNRCGKTIDDNFKLCKECRQYNLNTTIKSVMKECNVDYNVARGICFVRLELSKSSCDTIKKILSDMITEEGKVFTKMVVDGIPNRKNIKIEEEF